MRVGETGGDKVGEKTEEEEKGTRAKFLSIFIMVHFNFYLSQSHLSRLAQCAGTNKNNDKWFLDEAQFIFNLIKLESEFYSGF